MVLYRAERDKAVRLLECDSSLSHSLHPDRGIRPVFLIEAYFRQIISISSKHVGQPSYSPDFTEVTMR